MRLNQINKLRMYQATLLVLNNFSNTFSSVLALADAWQRLIAMISDIEENRRVQETATSGLTKEKDSLKEKLITQILKVSSALVAYATATSNKNLKTKAFCNPSRLMTASDSVVADIGGVIAELAVAPIDELGIYFVDQAVLDELNQLIVDFRKAIPQNRVATSSRKSSTKNLNELFKSADRLLKEELDMFMLPFKFTHPDFYDQYRNARIIIDYTGRGKSPEIKSSEEETSADV